jgi:murein DD-endopeptidase MepM/ murein hydrolase activator NlpD
VSAFWPFSVTEANGSSPVILHDASLDLLQAPLSTNVDDPIQSGSLTTPDGSALIAGTDSGPIVDPSTDSTDTISVPTSGSISQYTVKPGDSLSSIAASYGVSVNTILWANNITNKSTIKTGSVLVILPVTGIEHTVRSGETLSSIAKKFAADASDVAQFNGLDASTALVSGSTIIIPGGELPVTSNTSSKTAKSTKKTTTDKGSSTKIAVKLGSTSTGRITLGINYSNATNNPYKGGGGAAVTGHFTNPIPGALLTQGIHGWNGVDLGAHAGTPIEAAAKGTVILSRMGGWNGGYGNYVIIDNGGGIETLYAHMTVTKVTVGDSVSAGETIGTVGTSGEATGPHLHFEVRGAENPFAHCAKMTVCQPE